MWIVQQGKTKNQGDVPNILRNQCMFLQTESPVTVTTVWQVTLVEYKDMWEWVCFLVLGVSASVNQSKQLGSDAR